MKMTRTYEPIRPLRAPDGGGAYCARSPLGPEYRVDYGESHWPSRSYQLFAVDPARD